MPVANATASPPEEPPGVSLGFHGFTVQRVIGVEAQREVRQVGAGKRDGPGGAQTGDHRRIGRGDVVPEGCDSCRRRAARHVQVLLDRERHPVQAAE
jgi:hypothetical protein